MKKNKDLSILADSIRLERHRRKWSQEQLAEYSNIGNYQQISRIENGQVDMRVSTLFAILRALNLKLEDLIDLDRKE